MGLDADDVTKVNDLVDELKVKSRRVNSNNLGLPGFEDEEDMKDLGTAGNLNSSKSIKDNVLLQEYKLRVCVQGVQGTIMSVLCYYTILLQFLFIMISGLCCY